MPKTRISRTAVDKLECVPGKQVEYFDTKLSGFGVRVNYNSKTYFVKFRIGPRQIKENIGRTDIIDYDDALDKAKAILENAANGIAPEDIRRQNEDLKAEKVATAVKEAKKDITVQEMLDEYLLTRKKLKGSTKELYQEDFDRYISDWKNIPLRSIDGSMIISRHTDIGAKSKARADGVMRVMRALFNHAMAMHDDIIFKNPVKKLSAVGAWYNVARKETYIRPEQLGKWVPAVMRLGYDTSQDFLLMLLFQGSRREETATLKWRDINLVSGTASFRETKTGVTLEVPISRFIVERLQQRMGYYYNGPDSYVFPSYGKTGHIVDLRSALKAAEIASGVKSSHHDLRRSFISYCEELEINTFTRKRLVNHAIPLDVTEGYTQFNIEKLRVDIEKVAAFILGHAGINYKQDPEPEIIRPDVWDQLSEAEKKVINSILSRKVDTKKPPQGPNIIDLEAVRVRRRLCA